MFYVYVVRDKLFVGETIATGLTYDAAKALVGRLNRAGGNVAFQMMREG